MRGRAVGPRIRAIEEGHGLDAGGARLEDEGGEGFGAHAVVGELSQGPQHEGEDLARGLAQGVGVLDVGGDALEAVEHEGAEAPYVLVRDLQPAAPIGGGESLYLRGVGRREGRRVG